MTPTPAPLSVEELRREIEELPRLAATDPDQMDSLFGTQPDGRYLQRAAVLAIVDRLAVRQEPAIDVEPGLREALNATSELPEDAPPTWSKLHAGYRDGWNERGDAILAALRAIPARLGAADGERDDG